MYSIRRCMIQRLEEWKNVVSEFGAFGAFVRIWRFCPIKCQNGTLNFRFFRLL